jgi:hypothetical protein
MVWWVSLVLGGREGRRGLQLCMVPVQRWVHLGASRRRVRDPHGASMVG